MVWSLFFILQTIFIVSETKAGIELVKTLFSFDSNELYGEFGSLDVNEVLEKYSASAIESGVNNILTRRQKKEIKPGDIVTLDDETRGIVLDLDSDNSCFVFTENGCVEHHLRENLNMTGNKMDMNFLFDIISA